MIRGTFQSKDPGEKISLPFDFTAALGSASITGTPTVALAKEAGDEGAGQTLTTNGTPAAVVGIVYVPVKNGVHFCDYDVVCTVLTNDARTLVLGGLLPVRNA